MPILPCPTLAHVPPECRATPLSACFLAVPGRLELPTFGLGNRCSIRLSYGTASWRETTRTVPRGPLRSPVRIIPERNPDVPPLDLRRTADCRAIGIGLLLPVQVERRLERS